jgi:predicted nuclease of restriction endonuclease-like (RecB) superfamily
VTTKKTKSVAKRGTLEGYESVLSGVAELLEAARRTSARATNAIMTATYWEIGRRIVEYEQKGSKKAGYGEELIAQLSIDLTGRFGRGFGPVNLSQMRKFFLCWPPDRIFQTVSEKSLPDRDSAEKNQTSSEKLQTPSAEFSLRQVATRFPLPWSHYVRLLSVKSTEARSFYETEALRGGWSVRQLDRQINSQFYERTALSRNKAAMLKKGSVPLPEDVLTPEEEIKDPFVLEFLGLKDEYSENDLEEALIKHLENFLLELGGDFTFVGRQRRLRVGDEWYRVDLLFYHRRLRCLVIIDLKLGKFTHADAGQMHLYLNYAREHWTHPGENPPVGLILCALKDRAVAKYALQGLSNKVLAAEYKTVLPDEKILAEQIERTRKMLEQRRELRK